MLLATNQTRIAFEGFGRVVFMNQGRIEEVDRPGTSFAGRVATACGVPEELER